MGRGLRKRCGGGGQTRDVTPPTSLFRGQTRVGHAPGKRAAKEKPLEESPAAPPGRGCTGTAAERDRRERAVGAR
eukprot:scaffold72575_cov44-Phaeocystis_antarctica.AAC.1